MNNDGHVCPNTGKPCGAARNGVCCGPATCKEARP